MAEALYELSLIHIYVSADDPGTADVVQVEGLVLRKEKVLTQEVDGVVAYVVEDGGRIQKDGTVGEIFSSQSDAAAQQQIEALDEQIADLERLGSSGNVHNSDQESLKNQTQLKLADVLKESLGGNFSSMQESREELLYTMNERQIVIGEAQGFEGRIEELKAKRESLAASGKSVGKIVSPEAGTFISQVDVYKRQAHEPHRVRFLQRQGTPIPFLCPFPSAGTERIPYWRAFSAAHLAPGADGSAGGCV